MREAVKKYENATQILKAKPATQQQLQISITNTNTNTI